MCKGNGGEGILPSINIFSDHFFIIYLTFDSNWYIPRSHPLPLLKSVLQTYLYEPETKAIIPHRGSLTEHRQDNELPQETGINVYAYFEWVCCSIDFTF